MTRSIGYLALWLAMAGTAAGQAAVEAGLGAAGAASTSAPGRAAGKAIGGIAGSLDKALNAAQHATDTSGGTVASAAKVSSPAPHATPAVAAKWEDPSGIEKGLSYQELLRRFGPPAMEITGETGKSIVYSGKGGTFHLEVEDDKVTSIRKPAS